MTILRAFIDDTDEATARAALYYVSRYVKQAGYFAEYKKDIFEDEIRSVPSENVKTLARRIIAALEKREGASATQFSREVVFRILDEITGLEAELGPEATEVQSARVERFIQGLQGEPRRS